MAQFQVREGTRDGEVIMMVPVRVVVKNGEAQYEVAPNTTYELFNASDQVDTLLAVTK